MTPSIELMTTEEILALWATTMGELKRRGVIRSSNNPVGDYAERLAVERLGLALATNSTAGYDAVDPDGMRYQVKGRRLPTPATSRQLGVMRNLDGDEFDYLIIVLFGDRFDLLELWKLPIALVREHATYRRHVNGHVLHAQGAVLKDERAIRIA